MGEVVSELSEEVAHLLRRAFPGAVLEIGLFYNAKRVSGHIIGQGFEGIEQIERQHRIYDLLRAELKERFSGVSIILAYTPREWELMGED